MRFQASKRAKTKSVIYNPFTSRFSLPSLPLPKRENSRGLMLRCDLVAGQFLDGLFGTVWVFIVSFIDST